MSKRTCLFAGFAGKVGGAGSEAFETARFFIAHGLEIHMVPTWESPEAVRREEVEALGVRVHCIKPAAIGDLLRELGGPPVVSFCNPGFLTHYRRFKEHSPTVWVNCMTSASGEERIAWKKAGLPSAFVFQSEFQRRILENRLARHQYRPELGHLIRGAFCWDAWEFTPLGRDSGAPFVVGRAARPDPAKWSSHTLEALDPVPNIRATCLGADDRIRRQLGSRKYAQLLAPGAVSSRELYRNLHAMICYNSTAKENWPRVGLEAMATGVPLVADGHWGWQEMIRHGETGFLARRTSEFTEYLRLLEADEALRQRIARQARHALETDLANPDAIWGGWCGIWRAIGAGHLADVTGPSPLHPTIESVRDLLAIGAGPLYDPTRTTPTQECTQELMGEPWTPHQEFIAGNNIQEHQPVYWNDGKVFGMPRTPLGSVQLDRPGEPCTPEQDLQDCAEHAVMLLERDTREVEPRPIEIHVRPEDARKLTPDVQEQQGDDQCPTE